MTGTPEPTGPDQRSDDAALAELLERLGRLSGQQTTDGAVASVAALEVATEELRVVEEEVRVQQEQIEQLLARYDSERHWRGHLSTLVPVGLCVTDRTGKLLDANPALATLLQVGLQRLRGKPLSVFLDPEDVPGFRSALRGLAQGTQAEHRALITVRGRDGSQSRAQLFGFPGVPSQVGGAEIQWVLIPELRARLPSAVESRDGDQQGRTASAGQRPDEVALSGEASLRLAAALVELAALPSAEEDSHRLMGRLSELVAGAVPGAAWVSVTIGPPAKPHRLGSSAPEAQDFDGRQMRAEEGPCWDAYAQDTEVLSGNVVEDPRWPNFGVLTPAGAVRSVLALPVRGGDDASGVLNIYSPEPDAFGPDSRRIAELVSAAVAGVLASISERRSLQDLAAHLEQALTSRAVIDQAKGVLMARLDVDADTAFARLVKVSNRLNVKLRDLARLVVDGHADEVIAAARR